MANRAAQLDVDVKAAHPNATVTRRGRNFIEHDLGDGKTRWTGTIEPLHTRADSTPIDTAWVADASPWSYRIAAADYAARIKAAFNGAPLLQYTDVVTGAWVTLQPQQLNWTNDSNSVQMISAVQGVTAQLNDDLVRWPGAYGTGRDFEYQNHPKRLIKRLVLQSALPAPSASILSGANPVLQLQFIFNWSASATVWIDGAQWNKSTAKVTTNRIEFRVGSETVFWFDAPTAYDASGENYATGVVMKVRKAGNNLYVEVRTPYAWLQGAQYPVTVDPTLTDGYGGDVNTAIDTYVRASAADTSYESNTTLTFRTSGDTWQVLMRFEVSSVAAGSTINSATLHMWNISTSTLNRNFGHYPILSANSGWIETSTWNYAVPSTIRWAGDSSADGGADAGCSVSGTDYNASSMGTLAYVANTDANTEHQVSLNTTAVAAWLSANYGMLIKMAESASGFGWHSSDSSTTGYRPVLVVDYTAAMSGNPWYAYAQM